MDLIPSWKLNLLAVMLVLGTCAVAVGALALVFWLQ